MDALAGAPDTCRQHLTALLQYVLGSRAEVIAARLISATGSLAAVLALRPRQLDAILPGDREAVRLIRSARLAIRHVLRQRALGGPTIRVDHDLLTYLRIELADEQTEQLRVLYLDSACRLIADETMQRGTVAELPIYPRELVIRALDLGATYLILVHNHPSGDPSPSAADIRSTRAVAEALNAVGMRLYDHIIVARAGVTSLQALNLI